MADSTKKWSVSTYTPLRCTLMHVCMCIGLATCFDLSARVNHFPGNICFHMWDPEIVLSGDAETYAHRAQMVSEDEKVSMFPSRDLVHREFIDSVLRVFNLPSSVWIHAEQRGNIRA
jgi:hypothetical protein